MMIALMFERNRANSHWKPYIDSMPDLPTSPVWWGAAEKDALQVRVGVGSRFVFPAE